MMATAEDFSCSPFHRFLGEEGETGHREAERCDVHMTLTPPCYHKSDATDAF
jgi:hypothetical protein